MANSDTNVTEYNIHCEQQDIDHVSNVIYHKQLNQQIHEDKIM